MAQPIPGPGVSPGSRPESAADRAKGLSQPEGEGGAASYRGLRGVPSTPLLPGVGWGGAPSTCYSVRMPRVTVATLNLFNRQGEWEQRFPLIVEQLGQLLPDVIGFQEVDLGLDSGMQISRAVNKGLATRPHYRIKHATSPGQRASVFGIATLAR